MAELEPEAEKKKFRVSYVIIALLAVVCVLQTLMLLGHQNRKPVFADPPLPKPETAMVKVFPHAVATTLTSPWDGDPFDEFDAVSRRVSNMMRQAFMMSAPLMNTFSASGGFDFMPAVDLEETEDAYVLRGDLPGLDKDKISVTVRDNIVTLEGVRETSSESQDSKKGFYSQERSYGSFARSLNLPGPVDESKISATYKDGVLIVTLPKLEGAKTAQKVTVQ